MIDEAKRKRIIYISIVFGVIIVLSIIGFIVFSKKDNLPPVDDTTDTSESTNEDSSNTSSNSEEEPSLFKNGVEFKKFEELSKVSINDLRVDVITYYLAEYASTQSTGAITTYTVDQKSIKSKEEGERQIYTFTVKDNNNTPYTVELSYIYSTDSFVQIFDKDGVLLQSSPTEDHDE